MENLTRAVSAKLASSRLSRGKTVSAVSASHKPGTIVDKLHGSRGDVERTPQTLRRASRRQRGRDPLEPSRIRPREAARRPIRGGRACRNRALPQQRRGREQEYRITSPEMSARFEPAARPTRARLRCMPRGVTCTLSESCAPLRDARLPDKSLEDLAAAWTFVMGPPAIADGGPAWCLVCLPFAPIVSVGYNVATAAPRVCPL